MKNLLMEHLLKAVEINDSIISNSQSFDQTTKNAFNQNSLFIKKLLADPVQSKKLNSAGLKSLTDTLLTFWNESISIDTEKFWMELKRNKIDFERKEQLRFALTKGWFRTVEQGIGARNNWNELKKLNSITDRYSNSEIASIDELIKTDEQKRLDVLEKCLRKKAIPQTQYLKFGECMAYFANCKLFDNYFTAEQVEELYEIWKNFKSN